MSRMDLVWFAREGDNEELRYSLRSVTENLPHATVWVVGHPPAWYTGRTLTPDRPGTKHLNTTISLRLACTTPEISDPFLLVDDDMYLLTPMLAVPFYVEGPLTAFLNRRQDLRRGRWYNGALETLRLLRAHGFESPLNYDLHVPIPVFKDDMMAALDMMAESCHDTLWKRTIYGTLHGRVDEVMVDVKNNEGPIEDQRWLSTCDTSFPQAAALLARKFPTKSRYEK